MNTQKYIDNTNVQLKRLNLQEQLNLGYEIVKGDKYTFIFNEENNDISQFFNWYNQFRFEPLSDKGKNAFKSILKHSGTFICIKPLGMSDDYAFPIFVQKAIRWNNFYENSKEDSGQDSNLKLYAAKMFLFGITKLANLSDISSFSDLNKLYEIDYVNKTVKLSSIGQTLLFAANPTYYSIELCQKLINSVAISDLNSKNKYEEISQFKFEQSDGTITKNLWNFAVKDSDISDNLIDQLQNILPNYPLISITSTQLQENIQTICTEFFEPPNAFINLDNLKRYKTKGSGSTQITPQNPQEKLGGGDSENKINLLTQDDEQRILNNMTDEKYNIALDELKEKSQGKAIRSCFQTALLNQINTHLSDSNILNNAKNTIEAYETIEC